jgi:hypothetical protein
MTTLTPTQLIRATANKLSKNRIGLVPTNIGGGEFVISVIDAGRQVTNVVVPTINEQSMRFLAARALTAVFEQRVNHG